MNIPEFYKLLDLAIEEDLSDAGDVTSESIFNNEISKAVLKSKGNGILAGKDCFIETYKKISPNVNIEFVYDDGDKIYSGDVIAQIEGPVREILTAERIALNFISYMSGISSETHKYVMAAQEKGNTVILDTRKTLPGYRKLAKYAVKTGGGSNHRMGLYDMVMIKDNHVDSAGSITNAVQMVRNKYQDKYKIEVECRNLQEVKEALSQNVDVIMLDNMDIENSKEALLLKKGNVKYEASGNMDLERVGKYSEIGLDYISIGKITHSVETFDFSLLME